MTIEAILTDILTELRAIRQQVPLVSPSIAELIAAPEASPAPLVFTAAATQHGTVSVAPAVPPVPTQPGTVDSPAPEPAAVFGDGPDLDAKGLPWDGRIHASSKAKIADGTWRQKRGADPAEVTRVEAELRQTMAAPAAPGEPWVPPVPAPAPAPVVPPVPAVPTVPPAPPGPSMMTYNQLTQAVIARIGSQTMTLATVDAACQVHGVGSFGALSARQDLVPVIAAELGLLL